MGKIICKDEKSCVVGLWPITFLRWTVRNIGDIEKYWKSGLKEYPMKKIHNSKVLAIGNTYTHRHIYMYIRDVKKVSESFGELNLVFCLCHKSIYALTDVGGL